MRVAIHIEIGELSKISYGKEILFWIRKSEPQIITFDFDNHSDPSLVNHGIELLHKGEEILIIIDQVSSGNTSSLLRFVDILVRNKKKSILVIYNGDDHFLDKMLGTLSTSQILRNIDVPSQKAKIKAFFNISQ